LEELHALGRLQLERDGELVALAVLRGGDALLDAVADPLDPQRQALASALARLDLDDARAEIGQKHRAEGHGDDLPQIENGDVAQRLFHGSSGGAAEAAAAGDSAPALSHGQGAGVSDAQPGCFARASAPAPAGNPD